MRQPSRRFANLKHLVPMLALLNMAVSAQTQLRPPVGTLGSGSHPVITPPLVVTPHRPPPVQPPAPPAPATPPANTGGSGSTGSSMPCLVKNVTHLVGKYVSVHCLAAQEGIHTLKMPMDKPGIGLFVTGLTGAALDGKTITLSYKDLPDGAGGVAGCSAASACAELLGTK
ncbi:MAG: hypothetical protein V4627_04245 [Pseudomonadota bacterium]